MGKIPTAMDAVANISITLYGNGEMSIAGNIGDVKLALGMIDHARDTINNQWKLRDPVTGILLPPRNVDVDVNPHFPLTQNADVSADLRMKDMNENIRKKIIS